MAVIVRLGGVAAFVAVVVFWLALGMRLTYAPDKVLEITLAVVAAGSVALAFLTTKSLFNAYRYERADVAIFGIVAVFLVFGGLVLADAGGWIYEADSTAGKMANRALLLAAFALSILFPIRAMGFARSGGGIWKAIGIVYLITSILLLLAIATALFASATGRSTEGNIGWIFGAFLISGGAVGTASLILHGIGLALGAGRMRVVPA